MPRKIFLAAGFLFLAALCFLLQGNKPPQHLTLLAAKSASSSHKMRRNNAARPGERILYEVKLGALGIGNAEFNNVAVTTLGGKPVNLVTFRTKSVNFSDLEMIYSDLDTFLPVKVERDVSLWPTREVITEEYDQAKFVLTIKKLKGKKENRLVITKDGPIHNAVIFPYFVRNIPRPEVGWTCLARFPTQQFKIELVAREEVVVPAGKFNAWRFRSTPEKFEIWISSDERRIPLKIRGIGGYTLLMRKYTYRPEQAAGPQ